MDPVEVPECFVHRNVRQLVFLNGLNTNNNRVHKSIYAAFTAMKRINYQLLTADYEPPRKSEKMTTRSSRGIIKVEWARKYLSQRPALIVVFIDLNWSHPNWTEKRQECESKIASLRRSVVYRDTRVALVLVQQAGGGAAADDSTVKERALELCAKCQLAEKQLFTFLTHEEHERVASRLDALFYDIGQQFYQSVLRRVRSRAVPGNHPNLLICQQLKLAFLSELRQDTHSALR